MNREAAALGIPVYSIFRGKMGAVDRHLEKEGRLTMVRSVEEAASKILLVARKKGETIKAGSGNSLKQVVEQIESIAQIECAPALPLVSAPKPTNG